MPPFKSGFVKDTVTPEAVRQTRKRKNDLLDCETENLTTLTSLGENKKRKTRRKIRATEELYNIPVASEQAGTSTSSEEKCIRTPIRTTRSFLPKINDVSEDKQQLNSDREQLSSESLKKPKKKKRANDPKNDQVPVRQTRRSTRISTKNDSQREESNDNNKISSIEINKKQIINQKSIGIDVQKEPKSIRFTGRKSSINAPKCTAKSVECSAKTDSEDDNFVSKESVHEILNCESIMSLKTTQNNFRLTYDVNDVKNSPAFIKNRRETYDVEDVKELKTIKEDKKITNDDNVRLETTFDATSSKSNQTLEVECSSKNQTVKNILQETEYAISRKKNVLTDAKNWSDERNSNTTTTDSEILKNNSLILENIEHKKVEASKVGDKNLKDVSSNEPVHIRNDTFTKTMDFENDVTLKEFQESNKNLEFEIENEKCGNHSFNESADMGNNTFTKATNPENDIILKEINDRDKNLEIENQDEKNQSEVLNNSINEALDTANKTITNPMDPENNSTFEETNESNKNVDLGIENEDKKNSKCNNSEHMNKFQDTIASTFKKTDAENDTSNKILDLEIKNNDKKSLKCNNPKDNNVSFNESLDIGNNTFTKLMDSENDAELEVIVTNKNLEFEIKKEECDVLNYKQPENTINSLNESDIGKNTNPKDYSKNNTTLKEKNESFNKLENISIQDKEGITKEQTNNNTFTTVANIDLSQNENNLTDNVNETQNVTYEKCDETIEIETSTKVIESNENKEALINETTLNNDSNDSFATASDYESSKDYFCYVNNVTITNETKSAEIKESSEIPSENETHSTKKSSFTRSKHGIEESLQNSITSKSTKIDNDPKTPLAKIINRRSTFEVDESINHVTLLKTVCDDFGTPRETENVKLKRKYGRSTPHPKKMEVDSYVLENETSVNLINSPGYILDDEKEDYKTESTNNHSDSDVSDSIFEEKRISSIKRLKKRRSKSLPVRDESLTEFLFNEKITADNYGKNITKRKKVTFKSLRHQSVEISPLDSPVKIKKTPKKLSASLPSLVKKYSHPTSMSTPKSTAASGLNKSNEPTKKITRTKLPNFAEIHKKMFNKMENIKEHSERKAERTKLLLSGNKPIDNNKENKNSSQKEDSGKSKKHLNFYQKSEPTNESGNVRKFGKIENSSGTSFKFRNQNTPAENQMTSQMNKPKNVTKFGFKIIDSSKIPTKEEQRKALASKTKIIKNNRDERRNHIQGVRSNRRFDLLMKMRQKKI